MNTIVMKFGGTSVAGTEKIRNIADIVIQEVKNNKIFFEDKIATAKFFFDRILPRIDAHYRSGISGSKNIMNFKFN